MRKTKVAERRKKNGNNYVGNIIIATRNIRGGIEGKINPIREWMQKDEIDICIITDSKFPTYKRKYETIVARSL